MTTESLQTPTHDDVARTLQYFAVSASFLLIFSKVNVWVVKIASAVVLRAADKARPVLRPLGFTEINHPKSAAWRVLRHAQFRRYFLGSLLSNLGTWLQNTAQMLLAYQFKHSVLEVGLVACVQFSPPLLCGPWASIVANRFGAKKILITTQWISGGITAIMTVLQFTHHLSQFPLLIGAFATGLMFTFALPAQSALIPALVPSDKIDSKAAVVMNSVAYNAGRMVAPIFSVLIVMTAGFGYAFLINAASFVVFAIILLPIAPLSKISTPKKSRVRDSIHIALNDRKVIILLMVVAAVTLTEDPILVLGPGLAWHAFHKSDGWSGYFLCALGAGSVVSSFFPRLNVPSTRRAAAALGILGISIFIFALAPWIWLSVAAAFTAGMAGLMAGSTAQAMLRQLAGPARVLEVMGLWAIAWAGSKPIASILDGVLPSLITVRWTGVIMAVPALVPPLVLVLMPGVSRWLTQSRSSQPSNKTHEPHALAESSFA